MKNNNRKVFLAFTVFATCLFLFSSSAFGLRASSIVDLGTLGGEKSYAFAINDKGYVLGKSELIDGRIHPFIYRNNIMEDIETPSSLSDPFDIDVLNFDINNLDQVIIAFRSIHGHFEPRSFYWTEDGGWVEIVTPGMKSCRARQINDNGEVVGSFQMIGDSDSYSRGFIWTQEGGMVEIVSGTFAHAKAINNIGQVVGNIENPTTYEYEAIYWSAETGLVNLGNIGKDSFCNVSDINDFGQVLGNTMDKSREIELTFVWSFDEGTRFLDYVEGQVELNPSAIDNEGRIVGGVNVSASLWTEDGDYVNLNDLIPQTLGWDLWLATDTNSSGQIVGYGEKNGGGFHAFLLTIYQPTITAILDFFDDSVSNGMLTGVGQNAWLEDLRLFFMRKMLEAAKELIEQEKTSWACFTLNRALLRCDGEDRPLDFVEGDAVLELNTMISDLMADLGCD